MSELQVYRRGGDHLVVYDLDDRRRYDIKFNPSLPADSDLEWPDWPDKIINLIKGEVPKVYWAKFWQYNSNANASNWTREPAFRKKVKHPALDREWSDDIASIIIDLNDRLKWTREQIADWLDSLDEQPTFELDFQDNSTDQRQEKRRLPALATVVKM